MASSNKGQICRNLIVKGKLKSDERKCNPTNLMDFLTTLVSISGIDAVEPSDSFLQGNLAA